MPDLDPSLAATPLYPPDIEWSAPPPAAIPPKPTLRRLFYGDDGLRAGWSVLLFFIIFAVIAFGLQVLLWHTHLLPKSPPPGSNPPIAPRFMFVGESLQFLLFAIPALLMSLIERRPFGRYGLSLRRMLPDFLAGIFWGVAALSALVAMLYLCHGIAFDGVALHGGAALVFAAKWAGAFFLVGLSEEFITRGYLQYTVARGVSGITRTMDPANRYSHAIGFWISALIFSVVIFAAGHLANSGENAMGIIAVGLAGITFAFSLYRTGTLWWAIGIHFSWDWAQSFLFGTPDSGNLVTGHLLSTHPIGSRLLSGGPDGPEGSLLVVPTLLAVCLIIHLTLPRRAYPLTADQSDLPAIEPLATLHPYPPESA